MVLSSCGGKLDLQNDGWGVELQMVLGEVEELARDGEQEKSMNRRKVLHNGESLEAIVIEICLQNRCSRPVLYREYNHAYMCSKACLSQSVHFVIYLNVSFPIRYLSCCI